MKRLFALFAAIAILLLLSGCGNMQRTGIARKKHIIGFIEKVTTYQQSVQLRSGQIDTNTFNINSYMQLYDLVKVKDESKIIDCFYLKLALASWPYIILKDKGQKIAKDEDDTGYLRKISARHHVVSEDSPMGYLQYLHFYQLGTNFGFDGHGHEKETYVITSKEQVESICHDLQQSDDMFSFSQSEVDHLNKLPAADFVPIIELTDDFCTIQWMEHSTHYGIYLCKYKISRKDFKVEQILETKLLETIRHFRY